MGIMITRLRLRDPQELRGSGTDLDSYFNRLKQHESAMARSAFGRRIAPSEARELGFEFTEWARQAVAVTGMGSGHSPAFAQQLHLEVLKDTGCDLGAFLVWGRPPPPGPLWNGL